MMIQNPDSMLDAQRRFVRAIRITFRIMSVMTFCYALASFWSEGVLRAFFMALLISGIVATLLWFAYLIGKPMGLRHIELNWKQK